jgi:hypothetical protein
MAYLRLSHVVSAMIESRFRDARACFVFEDSSSEVLKDCWQVSPWLCVCVCASVINYNAFKQRMTKYILVCGGVIS